MIFCNRMDVQKIPRGPPFTFFGTVRPTGDFKKIRKKSGFFFSIFSFLRGLVVFDCGKAVFESCAYPLFLFSTGHQSGHVTTTNNNNNGCHPSRSLVSGGAGAGGDSNDSDSVFSGSERGSNVSSTNGCKRKHHRECPNKTANKYPRNNSSGLCFFTLFSFLKNCIIYTKTKFIKLPVH